MHGLNLIFEFYVYNFSTCCNFSFTYLCCCICLAASSICRIMARRDLKEDRLGSALMWCKLSKVAVLIQNLFAIMISA